jgi:ABC-2 type transport system permease protein
MRILSNPITVKELRSRMRGIRAILPMMAYLVVLGSYVLIRFAIFGRELHYSDLANSGRELGFWLLDAQIFLVLLLAPAYAASAITIEKERETFEVMQATLLTAWDIVSGKTFSGVSYAVLLVLSSLPLLSLSFWMGGFDFVHLIWGFLIISTTAMLVSAVGILLSTVFTRSYLATGVTYGVVIFAIGGSLLFQVFLETYYSSNPHLSTSLPWYTVPLWFTFTMNPLSMLTVLDRGDITIYRGGSLALQNPLIDRMDALLSSIGIPYVAVHVILTVLIAMFLLFLASYFLFRSSREGNR